MMLFQPQSLRHRSSSTSGLLKQMRKKITSSLSMCTVDVVLPNNYYHCQQRITTMSKNTTWSSQSKSISPSLHGHQPTNNCRVKCSSANYHVTLRQVHNSPISRFFSNHVHVTLETASTSSDNNESTKVSSTSSSCSQGISLGNSHNDDEEEEQEEMFVVADPILGHGSIKEWGGPRRGGSLAEPTRFGDWERKGRCTDF